MNRPVLAAMFLGLLALVSGGGCSSPSDDTPGASGSTGVAIGPGDTESLILFRLDGDTGRLEDAPEGETIRGWRILQTCPITDQHTSEGIKDAMVTALENPPQLEVDCFMPRHAIRIPDGYDFLDWLICFQCGNYRSYEGGSLEDSGNIGDSLKPVLDRYLSQCN